MRRYFAVFGVIGCISCGSPTAPGECQNGQDDQGRGPTQLLTFSCAPSGSNFQCKASSADEGYCARPGVRDITSTAAWSSSNPSAAIFSGQPGFLRVIGAGQVVVSPGPGYTPDALAYIVAPGSPPERLADFRILVENASTGERIAGAAVEVTPDRGSPQSCESDSLGVCRFWVLLPTLRVRATKPGFFPIEGVAQAPDTNTFSARLTLRMSPQ
jgi:hypothetical protein